MGVTYTIFDRFPSYMSYEYGYHQFDNDWVWPLRRYFSEKIEIGLFRRVELMGDTTPENRVCFTLHNIHPNIWKTVLVPGIKQYADIYYTRILGRMFNSVPETIGVWIHVREKSE